MSRRCLVLGALCGLTTLAAACGGSAKLASPTTTASRSTATASPMTRTPSPPVATTPAATPIHTAVASRTPSAVVPIDTPPAGRTFERAPIDGAEMIVRESAPPQYAVRVLSGLPSGCHQFADATLTRDGTEIMIDVRNTRPSDPMIACTAIYGTHEAIVELGTDFVPGTTYRVRVNDRTIEFTAQ